MFSRIDVFMRYDADHTKLPVKVSVNRPIWTFIKGGEHERRNAPQNLPYYFNDIKLCVSVCEERRQKKASNVIINRMTVVSDRRGSERETERSQRG